MNVLNLYRTLETEQLAALSALLFSFDVRMFYSLNLNVEVAGPAWQWHSVLISDYHKEEATTL